CAYFYPRKLRIEIGGKIGNQAAAKREDKSRARELGEGALQVIFDRHGNPGLPLVGLRRQAVDDFTLGPRAGAPIAARAANDAAQRLIVAFDHGGAGNAGLDRAELYRHLSLRGIRVVLGQLGPVEACGHGRDVREDRPYRRRRSRDHKTLLEPCPTRAYLFDRGRWRGGQRRRDFASRPEGMTTSWLPSRPRCARR